MGESINTLGYEVREWQECRVYKTVTRCRTMKGQVGGVLEELENRQTKLRPFEKSCSETAVPKSGESKQLDQTEVLVNMQDSTN